MNRTILAGMAVIAGLAATVPADAAQENSQFPQPGRYEFALQHNGLRRAYLVHIPESYRVDRPAALVMALHGGGGNMAYQASDERYGLISKSEQTGFIAVFPNGTSRLGSGKLATWNAGACCGRARDTEVDDVGFLRHVVEDVSRRANVDRRRVYAIGMSNGAMMSYRLACEAPDVFKGIMAVAGTDNTTHCEPQQPVPILHIHARNDDKVLFNGGAGNVFRGTTVAADFVSVPDTITKWIRLNHANTSPRRVLATAGAWCDRYDADKGGAPVQLCVTDGGSHSWPGGHKSRGDEPPSQAINANDVMWEFFRTL